MLLLMISTVAASSRNVLYTGIAMSDERNLQPGKDMVLSVSITNKGSEGLKDVDVTVSLLGHFIREKNRIDRIKTGETESTRFYLRLPDDLHGYEYIKITVNHKEYKRTIYREIRI